MDRYNMGIEKKSDPNNRVKPTTLICIYQDKPCVSIGLCLGYFSI